MLLIDWLIDLCYKKEIHQNHFIFLEEFDANAENTSEHLFFSGKFDTNAGNSSEPGEWRYWQVRHASIWQHSKGIFNIHQDWTMFHVNGSLFKQFKRHEFNHEMWQ